MNYYWGSLFDIDTTNENYPRAHSASAEPQ